jgi:hypothetical protein
MANAERLRQFAIPTSSSSEQEIFLNQITLVVVMIAVETWKALQAP